ncbi:MAG: PAS domain S-box protein [Desulfovibrio sp.]|nr:PAS domain S-box protein [Desulfovibrio sp.]MBI4958105.1 PAS domain S-box protein [Desulfovibrio sp.]
MPSSSSLRFRLIAGLAMLACLGVGLEFAVFGRIAERIREDVARRNQELAHALAGEVAIVLSHREYALRALSKQLEGGVSGKELQKAVSDVQRFTGERELFLMLDNKGIVQAVAPPNPDLLGMDYSSQPFFVKALGAQGAVYSESVIASQSSAASATISARVPGGVAVIQLRVGELSELAMVLPHTHGGFTAVVDDKGVVLGHCMPQVALQRENLSNLESVRRGKEGFEGTIPDVYNGESGIASVSPVGKSGWQVVVYEPNSHAYMSVRSLYSYTLVGVIVVGLLSVLIMYAFQAQLLRPIATFSSQARAVAKGDFSVDIAPGVQEFEPLAESFRIMVGDLKAREHALKESRRRISSIMDAMPSFLASTDSALRIELWNHEAEKLTGVAASMARGRTPQEAVKQLAVVQPALEQASRAGIAVKWEKVTMDFGQGRRIIDVLVYPVSVEENAGVVLRLDDITDRIRMEEVMVHSEKMMTVGGLAAGMAHEINNPLGGIIMSAQNLARRLSTDLPANQEAAREAGIDLASLKRYLEKRGVFEKVESIRELGSRAGKIVSNMLGFSRRSHSGYIPVKVEDLVERALDLAANDYDLIKKIDFKKIRVRRDCAPGMEEVPVNRNQIEQVFLNLFKNAAQAMADADGQEAPEITIRTWQTEDEAKIEISDNGPGIAQEVLDHIFEPFFTTKEVGQGTGLGLSVSYYIITTMHGGTIEVASEPGQGTRFIVSLPLVARAPRTASGASAGHAA